MPQFTPVGRRRVIGQRPWGREPVPRRLGPGVSWAPCSSREVLGRGHTRAGSEPSYYVCAIRSEALLVARASPEPAVIRSPNLASLSGHQGRITGEGSFVGRSHVTRRSHGSVPIAKEKGTTPTKK